MGRGSRAPVARGIDGLPNAVRAAEAEIATNNAFETAIIFDDAGNEVWRQQGDGRSVDVSEAINRGLLSDRIFTHNHPNANGLPDDTNTFSSSDWRIAIQQNVRVMRAVTATHEFTLTRPAGGWPPVTEAAAIGFKLDRRILFNARQEYQQEAGRRRRAGDPRRIDTGEMTGMAAHQAAIQTAEEYGIGYTRTPRRR